VSAILAIIRDVGHISFEALLGLSIPTIPMSFFNILWLTTSNNDKKLSISFIEREILSNKKRWLIILYLFVILFAFSYHEYDKLKMPLYISCVIVFVYTVNVLLTEYRICKNIYGTSKDEILEILHFIYKNKKYIDGGGTQVFEGNYDELENIMEKRLKEVIHGY
jgi:hypothetical protein